MVLQNKLGKLFLILGPSGVGKGTIIRRIREKYADYFVFPISVTTREPRPGEEPGETYYFLSKDEFQRKIENHEFLEWAIVHEENYYGTLKQPIFDALDAGKNVIRELDIQGFESIATELPYDEFVSIFLLPPSLEILQERIKNRSPLSDAEIRDRMKSAATELGKSEKCHYRVQTVDKDVEGTFADVEKIILRELEKGDQE